MESITRTYSIPLESFTTRLLNAAKNSKTISSRLELSEVNPELGTAVYLVKILGMETCKARFSYFKQDETTTQCVVQFFDWPLPTWDNVGNRKIIEKLINKTFESI